MGYRSLTEETAVQYVKEHGYFEKKAKVTCHEIGDGNLNYVFRLHDGERGIIVKQALPYAKVVGESWPLSLSRATIESQALQVFAKYVPEYVPKVYGHDEELAVTVMEDLSTLTITRKGLREGEDYPLLSQHIGRFLAHVLFYTSDFGLLAEEKRVLDGKFVNPDLCKITEDLVFTDPFGNYETNDYEKELQPVLDELWCDKKLKLQVAQYKYKFLTRKEALIHGDLHTGSIFSSPSETKVIDPEFATFGPLGFDLGQFIANLLLNALSREDEKRNILFYHIEKTWSNFVEVFTKLWVLEGVEPYTKEKRWLAIVLQNIFADAVGFAGCEIIRRTIGLAHVVDLDGIKDKNRRIQAKKHALYLGRELLLHETTGANARLFQTLFQDSVLGGVKA
ncbi:S-methyl-5-thioribose kinase [Bacillus pseudomycoides]|uniref:S-methyl-5-thioribose kinase n=1 Tax=Bacillus TaxID=1386 RepID=UPI000BED1186|nr:S-methyl-5-thioribose kinase [Bacillus pseudomycoides]MBD5795828.1 S-methyl-5-thioribose kinase [Bacillus pseudomycoides]MCR8857249.1 S-methyl-5-thioribose kinase [Bacillus pseudomycoides]MED1474008.1 S-methyl-5-thioribose kinase [Bacillus pseudomycoides]PDZ75411.1 S-methyl-5-thioribose kinase [Bacillus pseudomycoides]PEF26938.1 S-methyl-5-thioribose kinase [Bacillus pseudomycoides]